MPTLNKIFSFVCAEGLKDNGEINQFFTTELKVTMLGQWTSCVLSHLGKYFSEAFLENILKYQRVFLSLS